MAVVVLLHTSLVVQDWVRSVAVRAGAVDPASFARRANNVGIASKIVQIGALFARVPLVLLIVVIDVIVTVAMVELMEMVALAALGALVLVLLDVVALTSAVLGMLVVHGGAWGVGDF